MKNDGVMKTIPLKGTAASVPKKPLKYILREIFFAK